METMKLLKQMKLLQEELEKMVDEVASGKVHLPRGRGIKRKVRDGAHARTIDQDYTLEHEIGKGQHASVRLCRSNINGKQFACKTLSKRKEDGAGYEIQIMKHVSGHPGIINLEAVYQDSESCHLVMELCSGGDLLDHMIKEGPFSEAQAASMLKELMLSLKHCHDRGVVHRDVKPDNILLTSSGCLKLADFGFACKFLHGESLSGRAGTSGYVAPEVLVVKYTEKVDIWSAGVVLHALLVGFLPFQGNSTEVNLEAVKTLNLDFDTEDWMSISRPARELIGRMLTRDVSSRATVDEVLRHPWIVSLTEPH